MAELTLSAALQRAIQHHQAGRLPEAETLYRAILARDPKCADAWHGLGAIALQFGQHEVAVETIGTAAVHSPDNPAIFSNLGEAYRHLGRFDDSVASFRQALVLQPASPSTLNNLANALAAQGHLAEALACCRRALALQPDYANAHNNLGICLTQLGRRDEATTSFQTAIALNPALADAYNNLGSALVHGQRLDEALDNYQRSIALRPTMAEVHDNLGGVLQDKGLLDQAIACYRKAVALKPASAGYHSNLVLCLQYAFGGEREFIAAELDRWNQQHARPLATLIRPHSNDRSPDRRLRIGYVSADFRLHPVGCFLRPLFAAHDRRSFELFCYSNAPRPDHITAELRRYADGWREVAGQSDQQVSDAIREDRIDILVDLALHTGGNRLRVFAQKPAPVQATYLAYPGSSGIDTIDYRFTDIYLDPPGQETRHGPERPIRLPETYWCYQAFIDPPPAVTPLPALTVGHVTFSCLNSFCKVTPPVLSTWCRLLTALPTACLVLHAHPGSHQLRVQDFFSQNGIDPRRVRFIGRLPAKEYLQSYQTIDLGLDPFPFPGGTSTCDALWMGVPVVSLAGPTPVTRAGLSLSSNVGLPEFVALTVDDYVAKAVALGSDLPRLAALRASLRDRMQRSPLMDGPRFARAIEAAYRTMWHRWCNQPSAVSGATS